MKTTKEKNFPAFHTIRERATTPRPGIYMGDTVYVRLCGLAQVKTGARVAADFSFVINWLPKCCAFAQVRNMVMSMNVLGGGWGPPPTRNNFLNESVAEAWVNKDKGASTGAYLDLNKALGKDSTELEVDDVWLYMTAASAVNAMSVAENLLYRGAIMGGSNMHSALHAMMATAGTLVRAGQYGRTPWITNGRSGHKCAVFQANSNRNLYDKIGLGNDELSRHARHLVGKEATVNHNLFETGGYHAGFTFFGAGEDE